MHDAHESVISDVAAPWKPHLQDFKDAEQKWAWDLRARFGLPADNTDGCKYIDYVALFIEAKFLMRSKGEGWVDPLGARTEALRLSHKGWHPACLDPRDARNAFIARFHSLTRDRDMGAPWWQEIDDATIHDKRD